LTDEQFTEVMDKLFETVGKKFHSIGRSCRGKWFMRSEWTQAQGNEFEKWLKNYTIKKLRIPAKLAEQKAGMFCLNYGWKYKS
jgi:hypothetical protein